MSQDQGERFECWCIVEIMGRQTYAGYVTERTIAGAGMLQIDVPQVDETHPSFTKFVSPSSLYGISPVSEEIARHAAAKIRVRPVQEYGLLPEPKPSIVDSMSGESEQFPYRHPSWYDNNDDDDDDEVEPPSEGLDNDNDLTNKVDDDDSAVALMPRDKDIPFWCHNSNHAN